MSNNSKNAISKIEITQTKSLIGCPNKIAKIVKGLGLKKIRDVVVHNDNNCIRGMVNKASHLISYRLITDSNSK